jgi:hypothetical protein
MSASLNVGNTYVRYDLRLDGFIDEYQFDGVLIINCSFPYLLPKLNEAYCIAVSSEHFETTLFKKESRRIAFAGTRNWVENQQLSARHSTIGISSTGNTVLSTSVVIAVEVKKTEFDDITKLINNIEGREVEFKSIMQNVLEIILYKYNEQSEGFSFVTPSYYDYDRIHFMFIKNYFYKRFIIWEYIAPNDISPAQTSVDETAIQHEKMAQEILTWKYFLNKANYHFMCCEYLDSIISAAVAIESYALTVVRTFCKNETEEKLYTSEMVINDIGIERPSFLPMHKLIKKLKADNKINTSLSNTQIDSYVSKVLNPRNDIMHGKIAINTPLHPNAIKVNEALNNFFNSISQLSNSQESSKNVNIIDSLNSIKFHEIVDDQNIDENLKIVLVGEFLERYPQNLYISFIYSSLIFNEEKKEEAFAIWEKILYESKNKCNVAIDIATLCIPKERYELAFEILQRVPEEQRDARFTTMKALLYYKKYRKTLIQNNLVNAIDEINKSLQINTYYHLTYRIALEIFNEIEDYQKSRQYARCLYDFEKKDYESILYSAECGQKMCLVNDCYIDFNSFIRAYEENNHIQYRIDYYTMISNSFNIYKRASNIMKYLSSSSEIDKKSLADLENKLNRLRLKNLKGELGDQYLRIIAPTEKNISPHLIKMEIPALRTLGNVKDNIEFRHRSM